MFIFFLFFFLRGGASVDIVVEVGGFYLFFLSSCELTFTVFACASRLTSPDGPVPQFVT
jgi:hypothetical protein